MAGPRPPGGPKRGQLGLADAALARYGTGTVSRREPTSASLAILCAVVVSASLGQPKLAAGEAPLRSDQDHESAVDLERSRALYAAAEQATSAGQFAAAARDYALAYEITKDPILFYKIGVANKRADQCDTAIVYFTRYLREGHPTPEFRAQTERHIEACGGASATPAPRGEEQAGAAAIPLAASPGTAPVSRRLQWAWTATGTALAAASMGTVLMLSAGSTGEEIDDLMEITATQDGGLTPNQEARKRELEDERRTLRTLGWVSFGVAGAAAVAGTVLFLRDDPPHTERLEVAPLWTPSGGGIAVTGRF